MSTSRCPFTAFLQEAHPLSKADYPLLTTVFMGALFGWIVQYVFFEFLMNTVFRGAKHYHAQTKEDKAMYLARIVAAVHAFLATAAAAVSLLYTCEDGSTMITSDACLMRPTSVMQYWSLVSGAYFMYDLLVCVFLIREDSPIMRQTYLHHILGVIGTIVSVYVDNHVTTICVSDTPHHSLLLSR